MNQNVHRRSLRRWSSFMWMKGLLLVILLQLLGASPAWADTKDPQNYFKITHVISKSEPYYEWEYIDSDEYGITDAMKSHSFYVGWDGKQVKILSYGKRSSGETQHNTEWGKAQRTTYWKDGNRYHCRVRFYPSNKMGTLDACVLRKNFYILMTGDWDIDDNGSIDVRINKALYPGYGNYTNALATPDVVFERISRTQVRATSQSAISSGDGWNAGGICFTRSTDTQSSDIYHKNDWGNGAPSSDGIVTKTFTVSDNENAPITFYYHRYQQQFNWGVYQLQDGVFKSYTIKAFQEPMGLVIESSDKYTETIKLKWSNQTSGRNTNGKNAIFRKTDAGAWTKTATLNNDVATYTDNTAYVGHKYEYKVMFIPTSYGNVTQPDLTSQLLSPLNKECSVTLEKKYNVSFSAEAVDGTSESGGIRIKWGPEVSSHNLTYKLLRYDSSSQIWVEKYNGTSKEYLDNQSTLSSFKTYKYRIETTYWNTTWSKELDICYNVMTKVNEVKGSKGTYSNMVKLSWTADQKGTSDTRYVVSRKTLNDVTDDYTDIYEVYGTASSYYYDDVTAQPGMYYLYRVTPYVHIPEGNRENGVEWGVGTPKEIDGFSQAKGLISGRVSYGSGTAVEGVKMTLDKVTDEDSGNDNRQQYYSLASGDSLGVLQWTPSSNVIKNTLKGKPFTVQMWVKDNTDKASVATNKAIMSIPGQVSLYLVTDAQNNNKYKVQVKLPGNSTLSDTELKVPVDSFSNISLSYNGSDKYSVMVARENVVDSVAFTANALNWENSKLVVGGDTLANEVFYGFIDDVRVWSRGLTKKEIKNNYQRILSGTEQGLTCYWPMDEGILGLPYVYDYSKKNGTPNSNHATMMAGASPQVTIPTTDQLSLYGITNGEGYYEVRGIPFTGDGTSYTVKPTMGIHEFNPQYTSRYISASSLTHSAVDFDDVSSFPVSGVVYYEGTTIPVDGAYIYVDGSIASRDGSAVVTNSDGEFTVDVPIGDHFIQIKKTGHEFVDNGRYPVAEEGVSAYFTCEKEITGLTFFDKTLVTIAGRVAGGQTENDKYLGMGLGKANIGKAVIRLQHTGNGLINAKKVVNELSVSYEPNTEERTFNSATDKINSNSKVGLDDTGVSQNFITITTDPKTGEWSAKVPPLRYNATSISIPTQSGIDFSSKLFSLDATNPMIIKTDSLDEENVFKYCAAGKVYHRSTSHLEVTEGEDGIFGVDSISATLRDGTTRNVPAYTVTRDDEGNVTQVDYAYTYPVYLQKQRVSYDIFAYEEYINNDSVVNGVTVPVVDVVPLANLDVTVRNQFASTTSVYITNGVVKEMEDNQLTLDSLGHAKYQFNVGLPNIGGDYTRTLNISYVLDDNTYSWSGNGNFKAIVLGGMPKGQNFVTNGPDKVLMVLRDPPGTNSSVTWSKGTSTTKSHNYTFSRHANTAEEGTLYLGCNVTTSAGLGFAVINDLDSKVNLEEGYEIDYSEDHGSSNSVTITSTMDISTSSGADFVGAVGDVFIGNATNIILGACTNVGLFEEEDHTLSISTNDAISMSEQFKTSFSYTQNYIENVLLDQFKNTRNSLLPYIGDLDYKTISREQNKLKYYSLVPTTHKHYGASNSDTDAWGDQAKSWDEMTKTDSINGYFVGPSYVVILPQEFKFCGDTIDYFNNQITSWKSTLADNERAKIKCINNIGKKWKKTNYSFDAGSIVSFIEQKDSIYGTETRKVYDHNWHFGVEGGYTWNKVGLSLKVTEDAGMTYDTTNGKETTESQAFSVTLEEDGDDDYLSVDVFYPAPDGYGPIFYTRAGATCAPWEDEVRSKYELDSNGKGYILQQKTLQIEKPELSIPEPIITGVPSGKSAKFRIEMYNRSETGEDCYYGLWVDPESNPDGAQIFMDGKNIATGIDILVPAGEEPLVKTLELRQTDTDILDYVNLSLCMYSTSQPDDTGVFPGIYSNDTVSVHFQPSVTDIDMVASRSVVNIDNADDVTFSMSGYDYTQATFKEIRVQYKGENDANFTTLKTFTKDAANDADKIVALSGTAKLTYKVDMSGRDFTDQTYVFRALAVGYRGSDEVTTPSDEIRIVRDMSRPQLITMPTPTSGILLANDVITLTFNEDIRDNLLTKVDNFVVTGRLNESDVAHDVALALTGAESAAKTESTINLANKPFSVNLWMKYTQDGRILQHGTLGQQFTAAVVNGKLAVTVGNQTVTSTEVLPTDKWLYLAISYDNTGDTPVLTAGYGLDASSVILFKDQTVGAYEGNGPVSLGGDNLNGMVQELSLWNSARSMDEALGDIYKTKNQYTTGLLGYWQMNEGYGLQAADRSRSRNMTLAAENAWFLNSGTNYELSLDGTKAVVAPANLTTLDSESYLAEAWFKADAGQTAAASILSMKNRFDIRLNASGALELGVRGDYTTAYSAKNLFDGQWHHVALNVLKNNSGSAILYLDGKATRQFSASIMPQLIGTLTLGSLCDASDNYSQHLQGAIDEVRVWKGSRTADLVKAYMHTRVRSDEEGLIAYYPMEERGLDQSNQVVTSATLSEMTGQGNTINAGQATAETQASLLSLANAPALENVQFHYVASERQISISLDEQPYKMENCNIYLTARNIQDLNGNKVEPISWTVYVQQNQLKWEETEVEAEAVSGEGLTFTAELTNRSATTDVWSISNMPSWLSANVETGALSPVSTQKIKFTVDPSVAVGNYEVTVYAVGSQNIQTPLTIKLKVLGQVPDWNPVPNAETMAVIGQLKVDGVVSYDTDDMIGAFCEQKCVGVAHPVYSSRYDSYMITMNIFGDETLEGKTLNYKVYDASTGTIYPSVAASNANAYTYTSSKLVGTFGAPVVFAPENKIEQDLSLDRNGWKWFSMYVTPASNNVKDIYKDANGKINLVKGQTAADGNTSFSNGQWDEDMSLNPAKMYKLRATEAFAETSIGTPVLPANTTITLNSGWSWIGYPAQASQSLAAAFADASPQEGDILMSQSLFAIYSGGNWEGSLRGVTPGEGYKYYSTAADAKTFKFQTPTNGNGRSAAPAKAKNILTLNCEDNMAVVAQVVKDGQVIEDAEVSVYTGDELCGYSASSDLQGRHFITVGGSDKKALTYVIRLGDEEYVLDGLMTFQGSKLCGSLDAPYVLDMDQTTAIKGLMAGKAIRKIDVYDANGALLRTVNHPAGLLNANTLGNVSAGTYLQHITYEDGKKAVVKLLK